MQRATNATPVAGLGYRHFGPFLLDWYNRLVAQCSDIPCERVFMLGRDSWNLVPIFNTLEAMRDGCRLRFVYLQTSRALLTHISITRPDLLALAFRNVYDGCLRNFFTCRLGLPFVIFDAEDWGDQWISLPRDRTFVEDIYARGLSRAETLAVSSKELYRRYLKRQGVVEGGKNVLSDLGFRGYSQALLSTLYDLDFTGFYALLDPSGVPAPLNLTPGSTFGLFSDSHSFGGGFAPLEESLLFEAFLTSPQGQVVGIDADAISDPFLYRPATAAQENFGIIAEIMQGALRFAYDNSDLIGTNEIIICDFEAFFENFKQELKQKSVSLKTIFELDNSFFGSPTISAEVKLWKA